MEERNRWGAAFATGLAALALASPAHGASGTWERTWGEDVVQMGMAGDTGLGFEICTTAIACKIGTFAGDALGGELTVPAGVATDAAGNVYVSDGGHHRIQKFNSSGVFERAWGGDVVSAGPGETGTGFEICVAANGDTCKSGITPATGGTLNGPGGLATDAAGNVYVADTGNNRVQKFSATGTFERAWGEDVVGTGPGNTGVGFEICVAANGDICKTGATTVPAFGGEMNGPFGVEADGVGNVYVADFNHHRVQKFNSFGAFDRAWGEDVASAGGAGFELCVAANGDICKTGVDSGDALGGEMSFPAGITTDAIGNVSVAEFGHHRVQRFSGTGTFERAWGEDVVSAGPGDTGVGFEICVAANGDTCKTGVTVAPAFGGEMFSPAGVAIDAAGDVYVGDQAHDRVQRFSATGMFERVWGEDVVSAGPGNTGVGFEICVAANGDTCKIGVDVGTALGGEMNAPTGVATDSGGNLYVADQAHQRVQRFADPVQSPPPGGGGAVTPTPQAPQAAQPTGQRAAALKKCKKRKKGRARKSCIAKAKKLPL